MPDIQDVLDVTFNELSSEQQLLLKEAVEQFQQKCLMSFSKNRSGVPFLKSDIPRVLMLGETDATTAAEKQEAFGMIQQAMEDIMARHNTAFLNSFRQMMVDVFGPGVDKHFEQGDSSAAAAGQPSRQDASVQPPPQSVSVQPTQHVDSQSIRQNPHQAVHANFDHLSYSKHFVEYHTFCYGLLFLLKNTKDKLNLIIFAQFF
jgi:hypothetical protein